MVAYAGTPHQEMSEQMAHQLLASFGVTEADLRAELERRVLVAKYRALRHQRLVAGAWGRVVRKDGMTACLRRRVPAESYHFWGVRLGYECWRDAGFLREFDRDNPGCVVKVDWDKTTVVGGVKAAEGRGT